jgi:hypothetical protein
MEQFFVPESIWRKRRRFFMSFWGGDEKFVTFSEMVAMLYAHSGRGHYIVRGI